MSNTLELRLKNRIERRELVHSQHEQLLLERGDGNLSDTDKKQAEMWREEIAELDAEVESLTSDWEAHKTAIERSKALRKAMAGSLPGVEADDDGVVYRDKDAYVWDFFITSQNVREVQRITRQWGVNDEDIAHAKQRLELSRAPDNTLSSNVGGLQPPQHIAQIFQVIDSSRDLVSAAPKAALERGTLTYPQIDTRPVVTVQATEKTEGGTSRLAVSMQTTNASTYLGGGDLSWQAINWSTPNALRLWFDVIAADYALKTETDAADVVTTSAFLNIIANELTDITDFAEVMTAIADGGAEVYANSGRMANVVIMAPDAYWQAIGLTSAANLAFGQNGALSINAADKRLQVIVSRGLASGEIIVGDINGLLVAETPGAPVEMQVVEPAIGGVEVGLIGAFEAVVVDDGTFSLITAAS